MERALQRTSDRPGRAPASTAPRSAAAALVDNRPSAAALRGLVQAARAGAAVAQLGKGRVKRRKEKAERDEPVEAATATPGPGAQDFIQQKLVQVCEAIRQTRSGGAADAATTAWYQVITLNGMCGGWVEIHKRNPEWIEDLWAAITSWTPPVGATSQETLDDLNGHMASSIDWCRSGRGAAECQLLLTTAFRFMDKLEPDAAYGAVPDAIGTSGDLETGPKGRKRQDVTVSRANAGRTVTEAIRSAIGEKNIHCIAHVETDQHHMSVRIRRTKAELVLKVVETEKSGIVTASSWDEVMRVLQGGIYLDPTDTEDQSVAIQIFEL